MKSRLLVAGLLLTLSACAHGTMRGSVAMKTAEDEAHVCLGNGEVKPGDRVKLFRNACNNGTRRDGPVSCEKQELGMGTIKENINQHYSVVQFDKGIKFEEGTFVEKL